MRSVSKIWLLVFAIALLMRSIRAADFSTSLDHDTLSMGEQATLSLKFDGASPSGTPNLPAVDGLQFQYAGQQYGSSVDFNSGQAVSSTTYTYTYIVTPQRDGRFTIPAMEITLNGQSLTSQPLTLTVAKVSAPTAADVAAGNASVFMKLVVPAKNVYVGQTVVGQLQIFLRDDVANFGNFNFTGQNADGFTIGKIVEGGTQRTQIGDHVFNVSPLNVVLTATRAGTLTVGPFSAGATIVVAAPDQQDQLYRQFGIRSPFGVQGQQKQISFATGTQKIECLPLPDRNKPKGFSGAIGDFTMTSSVGPTNLMVGDPVTLHVQISGHGSLDSVMLPDQAGLTGFTVYPPTVKTDLSDQLGLDGTKTFEEIVTPQNAGVHELPAFAFSFFNPDDGQYHTLKHAAVPLVIRAAGAPPLPTIAAAKNYAADNSQSPADIAPIKNDLGTLTGAVTPLIESPKFLVLQSLPVLAFLAALIWRKRADNLANNPRLRRKIYVAQLMQTGLIDLKKSAAANNPDEFFATLFRLLQEQLGERLDCPASAITESVIEEHPLLRGAAATTRSGLHEIFQLCNQARYAPVRGVSELNSVAQQFEKVIGELQNLKA